MFALFKKLLGKSSAEQLSAALLKAAPVAPSAPVEEAEEIDEQVQSIATKGLRREMEALLRAGPDRHTATARSFSRFAQWIVLQAPLATDASTVIVEALDMLEVHGPDRGQIAEDMREGLSRLRGQCYAAQRWKTGLDPDLMDEFPAVEVLLVIPDRETPGWRQRWAKAGGKLIGDRCVTLKKSGVLERFNAYGHPFPPYDWSEALDETEISRDEAEDLGLIR